MIRFNTKSGPLFTKMKEGWIEMDFPAESEMESPCPATLIRALGTEPLYCGKNRFDYLLELDSEKTVRELQPDFGLLGKMDMRGVIVTARSSMPEFDYVTRFFAPAVGVNEDPVTGSAQCCLGPFWEKRTGKSSFTGFQASSRGGIVKVQNSGDRVLISGQAVTVLHGDIVG